MDSKIENILSKYSNHVKLLSTIAIVITSIVAIAGGIVWYRSNIWTPKVEIVSVDFEKGICTMLIQGKQKTLYGSATLNAGGAWGVRFGSSQLDGGYYDTIELVKSDKVYEVYKVK